jgi:hypothetical protein
MRSGRPIGGRMKSPRPQGRSLASFSVPSVNPLYDARFGGGREGGPPSWVPRADGYAADIHLDFLEQRYYHEALGGVVPLSSVLTALSGSLSINAAGLLADGTVNVGFATLLGLQLDVGTWSVEWTSTAGPASAIARLVRMQADANNVMAINGSDASNKVQFASTTASASQVTIASTNNIAADTTYRAAAAYSHNNSGLAMTTSLSPGGEQIDNVCTMPTGAIANCWLGSNNGANPLNGRIRKATHWTARRISQGGLQLLANPL